MNVLWNGTFEYRGREFDVEHVYDEDTGPPWKEHDGHGPVSDWVRDYDEEEGEARRVLCRSRSSRQYYEFDEALKIAKRDGWGLSKEDKTALRKRLGKKRLTPKDVLVEAVERDFEYLRGWCNDEWHYCGVVVSFGGKKLSLWGIEDNATDYLKEVARDLADEICAELDCAMRKEMVAERPDLYPST